MVIYPIGVSDAISCAVKQLQDKGYPLIDHPAPEVTHLLLDVPSKWEAAAQVLPMLPAGVTVIGGNLNNPVFDGYRKMDLLKDPNYLAKNAAITADCAIRLAGMQIQETYQDCSCLIIGWGRISQCLAKLLAGLGCKITIAARKEGDRAMAAALGFRAVDIPGIPWILSETRLVFNTVPERILDTEPPKSCITLDLASRDGMPGEAVIRARGLPGKYAPISSCKLIAQTIHYLYKEEA